MREGGAPRASRAHKNATARSHEYHLVWLPPAPLAPPRLILCSSNGTFVNVSSASSASRLVGGLGSGAAPSERKSVCLSSLPRSCEMRGMSG